MCSITRYHQEWNPQQSFVEQRRCCVDNSIVLPACSRCWQGNVIVSIRRFPTTFAQPTIELKTSACPPFIQSLYNYDNIFSSSAGKALPVWITSLKYCSPRPWRKVARRRYVEIHWPIVSSWWPFPFHTGSRVRKKEERHNRDPRCIYVSGPSCSGCLWGCHCCCRCRLQTLLTPMRGMMQLDVTWCYGHNQVCHLNLNAQHQPFLQI